jgi:adenylate cyclase
MTEHADARDIVQRLNEYFEMMVDILFRFEGTLDKYVGDELMGLFGVPINQTDAPARAVACGLEMQQQLLQFNQQRQRRGLPPLHIGIGINTGQCVYGEIGSSKTRQITVIGDPVNTAARLCSIAQAGEVICSESTFTRLSNDFEIEAMPKVRVKGKQNELAVYRVRSQRQPLAGLATSAVSRA